MLFNILNVRSRWSTLVDSKIRMKTICIRVYWIKSSAAQRRATKTWNITSGVSSCSL